MSENPPTARAPRKRRIALIAIPVALSLAAAATIGIVASHAANEQTAPKGDFPVIELDAPSLPPGLEIASPEDLEYLGGTTDLEVMEWQTGSAEALVESKTASLVRA